MSSEPSVKELQDKIEEQRKHLIRLEERNQELAKIVQNVIKDLIFYQTYSGAEMFRIDYKTAAHMRQDLYKYKDIAEGLTKPNTGV